jgi:hypothetical protein
VSRLYILPLTMFLHPHPPKKQFAWLEAARCAGLSGKLYLGIQSLQCLEGDVTIDALPTTADSLPQLPGKQQCTCVFQPPDCGVWGGGAAADC